MHVRIPGPKSQKSQNKGKKNPSKKLQIRSKKRTARKSRAPTERIQMSACALKFALACSDPFHPKSSGVCIPAGATAPTYRARLFTRTVAQVGTNGYGGVYITPTVATDLPSFYYTDTNFGGDFANSDDATVSGVSTLSDGWRRATAGGSGVSASQLTTGSNDELQTINGRIVSVGIRVKYTDTELDRGGQFYCYASPTHNNVSNYGYTALNSMLEASVEPVSRRGCSMVLSPINKTECEFPMDRGTDGAAQIIINTNACYPWSGGESAWATTLDPAGVAASTFDQVSGVRVGAPVALIIFNGEPGNSFEIEYVAHVEYYGQHISQRGLPVESDPVAVEKVMMANQHVRESKASGYRHKDGWSAMYEALKTAYREVKPMIVPALESALIAML